MKPHSLTQSVKQHLDLGLHEVGLNINIISCGASINPIYFVNAFLNYGIQI